MDNFSGVYNNVEIDQAVNAGHIICEPYTKSNLKIASLDITLGHYFYRVNSSNDQLVFNLHDKTSIERYFDGPFKAITHQQWSNSTGTSLLNNISPLHPVIFLKPGERILAHSHEFVGIKLPDFCELRCVDNLQKIGIEISFDASLMNMTSINRLTVEIRNLNTKETVVIPVGEKIAQLVFYHCKELKDESLETRRPKHIDIENVMKTWSPNTMLPNIYPEPIEIPKKIEGIAYE